MKINIKKEFYNPQAINFTDDSVTRYVYSAAGEKLRVVHLTAVPCARPHVVDKRRLCRGGALCPPVRYSHVSM